MVVCCVCVLFVCFFSGGWGGECGRAGTGRDSRVVHFYDSTSGDFLRLPPFVRRTPPCKGQRSNRDQWPTLQLPQLWTHV